MSIQTISFKTPGPTAGGVRVSEGSDLPTMRPRTGKRGTDKQLAALLCEALQDMGDTPCSFWACRGPRTPRPMMTCRKCWAMRTLGTVHASLTARTA